MLADSFYSLQTFSDSGSVIQAVIHLNADHNIYKGHFPGNPVTPGVVEMELIKELLQKAVNKNVILKTLSNGKFLAVLSPEESPEVNVEISYSSEDEQFYKVSASIYANEKTFFKLQGNYAVK